MYIVGHIGLTMAAANAADRDIDLRLPALVSLLPDLIDKPLSLLLPLLTHENTRNFAHSLLGSLAVLLVFLALSSRWRGGSPAGAPGERPVIDGATGTSAPRRALVLWGCYLGHFLLDLMWLQDNPISLFWPFLGPFPPPMHGQTLDMAIVYNVIGELVGLAVLARLAKRHGFLHGSGWKELLKTGRLPRQVEIG